MYEAFEGQMSVTPSMFSSWSLLVIAIARKLTLRLIASESSTKTYSSPP
jgi:hypothetical protein